MMIIPAPLWAAESTTVLPAGINRFKIEAVSVGTINQYSPQGNRISLGQSFDRSINAAVIASNPQEVTALSGALRAKGLSDDLGRFQGKFSSDVQVLMPSYGLGISDSWSIGVGTSIWRASSEAEVTFVPSPNAQAILNSDILNQDQKNQLSEALNNSSETFNNSLEAQGYRPIGRWQKIGLGDTKLGAKWRYLSRPVVSASFDPAITLPTGERDDPRNVQDVSFTQGSISLDPGLVFQQNFWVLQSYQAAAIKLQTPYQEERLVNRQITEIRKQPGVATSLSGGVQVPWSWGHLGTGIKQAWKTKDSYKAQSSQLETSLAQNSDSRSTELEIFSGISTVSWFRQGAFPLPCDLSVAYQQVRAGKNTTQQERILGSLQVYY